MSPHESRQDGHGCASQHHGWLAGDIVEGLCTVGIVVLHGGRGGGDGGIQYGYHTELTNKNWMKRIRKTLNELNAICVPLQVSFKAVNFRRWVKRDYSLKAQPMDKLWAAFRWLDSHRAQYLPWWRNHDYVTTDPAADVLTALWVRPGEKALLCVSNLPNQERTITVRLDLNRLGMSAITARDAILGERVPVDDERLQLTIESRRWRLLQLTPR